MRPRCHKETSSEGVLTSRSHKSCCVVRRALPCCSTGAVTVYCPQPQPCAAALLLAHLVWCRPRSGLRPGRHPSRGATVSQQPSLPSNVLAVSVGPSASPVLPLASTFLALSKRLIHLTRERLVTSPFRFGTATTGSSLAAGSRWLHAGVLLFGLRLHLFVSVCLSPWWVAGDPGMPWRR